MQIPTQQILSLLLRGGHRLAAHLPREKIGYWATAAAVLVVTIWTSPFLEKYFDLSDFRNWEFQHLAQSVTNPSEARNIKLVVIRDDEFWNGQLHHRNPTDRSYLALLVRALDQADAAVIALDFDTRASNPSEVIRPGDFAKIDSYKPYRDETTALVSAIADVANRRKVVLTKTIGGSSESGYRFEADALSAYGICVTINPDGSWKNPGTAAIVLSGVAQKNISCGYIALMPDKRRIPPQIHISGEKGLMDSFPLAIVRARTSQSPELGPHRYFGTYVSADVIKDPRVTVSAHDLLVSPEASKPTLQGWPVVVGAAWHLRAVGRGDVVDSHDTPIGIVSGALIHENLAEAILDHRIFPGVSDDVSKALEIAAGIAAAVLFATFQSPLLRLAMLVTSLLFLLAVQWVILQLLGTFIDAYIPVFALGLHAIVGSLIESHGDRQETSLPPKIGGD